MNQVSHFARPLTSLSYLTFTATLIVALVGCSLTGNRRKGAISNLPEGKNGVTLEVAQTVDDQAKQDVIDTKTNFFIDLDQDRYAWERAHLFFQKYLAVPGDKSPFVSKIVGSRWALSNGPSISTPFTYEIWREPVKDGYRYAVGCKPSGSQRRPDDEQTAALNARNVARFIQDGKLELSLLAR